MGKKIVWGSSYTKCNRLLLVLAMVFEEAAQEIMAHHLRFKVTYYQHPSVIHTTITISPPPSPVSTLQSPFYHLHIICQHSLTLYNCLPDESPCYRIERLQLTSSLLRNHFRMAKSPSSSCACMVSREGVPGVAG